MTNSKGENLVRIYVTPQTLYHLNRMVALSKGIKYPGQVVDKIVRSLVSNSDKL